MGSNQSIRTLNECSRTNKVHKRHDTIHVQYRHDQLLQFRLITLHNHALRQMHPKPVSMIRKLKIQKKESELQGIRIKTSGKDPLLSISIHLYTLTVMQMRK